MPAELVKLEPQREAIERADPIQVVERARVIADELKKIVLHAKLVSRISGREYVQVEGWTTMLAMLSITPQTEWARRLEREGEVCYESRVILQTLDGRTVGAGEAMCSSKEKNWSNRDEFAIRSMAQTRATGKAARLSYSWIMKLAGFEPTPAEEMVSEAEHSETALFDRDGSQTPEAGQPDTRTITEPMRKRLYAIWKKRGWSDDAVKAKLHEAFGLDTTAKLNRAQYDTFCQIIETEEPIK